MSKAKRKQPYSEYRLECRNTPERLIVTWIAEQNAAGVFPSLADLQRHFRPRIGIECGVPVLVSYGFITGTSRALRVTAKGREQSRGMSSVDADKERIYPRDVFQTLYD